jgi:hypothetical protein
LRPAILQTLTEQLSYACSQICEKRLIEPSCLSVRPSVRMEQLDSHWTDFHESLYLNFLSKICRENSSFVKICQEQRVLYMETYVHFYISLRSSKNEKCFRQKLQRKYTYFCSICPSRPHPRENRAIHEIMWINIEIL